MYRVVFKFLALVVSFAAMMACTGSQAENAAPGGAAPAPTIYVEIDELLNAGNQSRLAKAIRLAKEQAGSWLVVSIDTPGGDVETMGAMGHALREAATSGTRIHTVAYISGGKFGGAWSAGAFLALACEKIYIKEDAKIGASLPVTPTLTPGGFAIATADRLADGKIINMLSARFREYAKQTGRPEAIAAAFVDPMLGVAKIRMPDGSELVTDHREMERLSVAGKTFQVAQWIHPADSEGPLVLSGSVAFETGFAQGMVRDQSDLFSAIGRDASAIVRVEPLPGERFVQFITFATPVLILLGIVCGFLEAKLPGFGIAGMISTICFSLVFYGRYLIGAAEVLHGVFFLAGLALLAVELFVAPGTFYAGSLGVLLILASLILAFVDPIIPRDAWDTRMLFNQLTWGAGIFIVATLVIFLISRYLPSSPVLRKLTLQPPLIESGLATGAASESFLVGREALAASDLRPAGVISIEGRRLDATTEGAYIVRGSRVRILEVASNRIVVEALASDASHGTP